jgi:hypothetical protein
MLLLHGAAVPSLWAAVQNGGDAGTLLPLGVRIAAMAVSAAFFALKIFDVRCLRLNAGWRTFVAAVLVVAVLHVGVVDRALNGDFNLDPVNLGVVFCLGTLGYTEPLAHTLRMVLGFLAPLCMMRMQDKPRWSTRYTELVYRPYALAYVPSYTGPRAPPAR